MSYQYSFSDFISGVYTDLGEPIDYNTARLSGWFLDSANIGKLNNLIGTCISGVSYSDEMGNITGYGLEENVNSEQFAIFKTLFEYEYYKNLTRLTAQSAAFAGQDWVSLSEGDSSITRVNKNELSKNFRGLANDAKKELDQSVKMYLKHNFSPWQIAGDDTDGVINYNIREYTRVSYT